MKKLLLGMAAIVASVLPCHADASGVAYNQAVANQVITTTTSFVLDLNAIGADAMSFQITASSANPTTQTFKDGTQSTGTITVVTNNALAAQVASDTLTVTTDSALVAAAGSATILVSSNTTAATGGIIGSTFTINGSSVVGGVGYQVGASSNATALNIVAAINGNIPNVLAAVSPVFGGTVTITCINVGSWCNSYSITSSTQAALKTSGNKFTGGNDNPSFTIADPIHTWIFPQGLTWITDLSYSSNTAVSIVNAINTDTTYVTASTSTSTTILIQTIKAQSNANMFKLTSSTGALSVTSANFTGGQDQAFLNIYGQILPVNAGASTSATATNIAAQINANSVLAAIMVATAPAASSVMYATGTIALTSNNYYWSSSTQAALTVSNTGLFGGTTSAYLVNTAVVSLPAHTLATGEAVVFTSGTITINPLVNKTTYYAIYVDANDIELATTSTGSIAGMFITLTSSSTAGPHTFTLYPIAVSGSELFTWAASNDCVSYSTPTVTSTNVTIPLNALTTPWTQVSYGYDFGNVNYRCLKITATGPSTAGNDGFNTLIWGYGKRYRE